jgi:hypothetical protein
MLEDEDFTESEVDIEARRAAKRADDAAASKERAAEKQLAARRDADEAGVRELLRHKVKGKQISDAGQAAIVDGVGVVMSQLCSLDLPTMRGRLGLSIMDARLLSNVLGKADVVAKFMVSNPHPHPQNPHLILTSSSPSPHLNPHLIFHRCR